MSKGPEHGMHRREFLRQMAAGAAAATVVGSGLRWDEARAAAAAGAIHHAHEADADQTDRGAAPAPADPFQPHRLYR